VVCNYKLDVAIMLNRIIYFLELDEANAQLRETRKGVILFVISTDLANSVTTRFEHSVNCPPRLRWKIFTTVGAVTSTTSPAPQ